MTEPRKEETHPFVAPGFHAGRFLVFRRPPSVGLAHNSGLLLNQTRNPKHEIRNKHN
jgi:hypothetical protein